MRATALILVLSMGLLASTSTQVGDLPVSKKALMSYPKTQAPSRPVDTRALFRSLETRPIGDFWDFSKPLD